MKKPLISVITVCYNAADELLKTSASVAAQQCPAEVEFVVVDGASSDSSPRLLADGTVPATRYVSEPDGGIFDAMNKGVALSTGEWLIFMNAGDTFAAPDTLAKMVPLLDESFDIIYGDALLDRPGSLTLKPGMEPANRHRMYFHHQAVFVRREVLEQIPYRLDVGLSGDYCFFKQAWIAGKRFRHVDVPVCIYDCTGVSSQNRMRVIADNISVVRRFDSFADKVRFLPRLYFVIWWDKLRRALNNH